MILDHLVLKHMCTHRGYTTVLLLYLKQLIRDSVFIYFPPLFLLFAPFPLNSSLKVFTQSWHIILDAELTVLRAWHPHCPGRAYTARPPSTPNASSCVLQNYPRNDREGKEGRKTALINKCLGISSLDRNGDLEIKICFQVWHWEGMKYTHLSLSVGLCCTVKAASKLSCVDDTWPCQSPNNNKKKLSSVKTFPNRRAVSAGAGKAPGREVPACRLSGQQRSPCPAGCHSLPGNAESHGQKPHLTPGQPTL